MFAYAFAEIWVGLLETEKPAHAARQEMPAGGVVAYFGAPVKCDRV